MRIYKNKIIISILIILTVATVLYSCKEDDIESITCHDSHIFFGGINVGMDSSEAQKAVRYSGWFDGRLDNFSRSVGRAKVKSAEFLWEELPLSGGYSVLPRVTFDNNDEVIMIGMNLILNGVTDPSVRDRAFESYVRDFIQKNNLEEIKPVISDKAPVKEIGEKSVFKTATKLYYDKDVKTYQYYFDKATKTGYAVLTIENSEADIPKYEIAFLEFKY
ncbi:MAG: hypothetical protein IKM61_04300 [Eubacteriaceae bacterium]|nr:hypothetical protein [Eubacteriaceae bacterium]